MIGIDLTDNRGIVAAFQGGGPVVLGESTTYNGLVGIAREQAGAGFADHTVVVTVPAWFHDGQRQSVADEVRSAGVTKVRLINRPTAVAMAYFAPQPADRSSLLVLELEKDRFDVTVLSKNSEGFEVLSMEGSMELDPLVSTDTARLAAEVSSAALRALKDAKIGSEKPSDIVCAGRADLVRAIQSQLETALGRKCFAQIRPEHAVALGAAVQAGLLARGASQPAIPQPETRTRRSGGCAGVLLVIVLATILLLL